MSDKQLEIEIWEYSSIGSEGTVNTWYHWYIVDKSKHIKRYDSDHESYANMPMATSCEKDSISSTFENAMTEAHNTLKVLLTTLPSPRKVYPDG